MNKHAQPTDWQDVIRDLKLQIRDRLQAEADKTVEEEVEKILGRVTIVTHRNLNGDCEWFINKEKK